MKNRKITEPLVSIIMGAYNCSDTLEKCITSIYRQTYKNWEFIICDDCSNDNTLEILKEYAKKDSRIIVLHNDRNCRLAFSLNQCLKVAKGKYVARMDADDESLPMRIEKQVDFLEQNKDFDVVGCARVIFDEKGDIGIREGMREPTIKSLLTNTPFAHPTIVMRKSVFDELHGYTVSKLTMRAEDLDLWFRFYHNKHRGYNLPEPLYKYHESIEDYSKRTLLAGWNTSKVFINGYKLIGVPLHKYPMALKPLISSLIPNKLNYFYHNKRR